MPQVKRFLKSSGGVDEYPDVRLDWIRHHTPELAIFENNVKVKTIDLSSYNHEGLHTLFSSHFTRRAAGRALADSTAAEPPKVPATNAVASLVGGVGGANQARANASGAIANTGADTAATTILPAAANAARLSRSSDDAALPQPVLDGWQDADKTMIAGVDSVPSLPSYFVLLTASALCLAFVVRYIARKRAFGAPTKPPALDV